MQKLYKDKYYPIMCSAVRKGTLIYIGKNHAECFIQAPKGALRNAEQGFLTKSGLFVDRVLGLEIAMHYGQVKHKHPPLDELMSEDML